MDQLIIRTGGHPDSADDLMHLQSAFQQAIDTLFQMMLRTPEKAYRLYGCQVSTSSSGDRLQTTEGGFFFQGEFFKVEVHDIPVPDGTNSSDYGWKIEQSYRPGNPVTYADGAKHSPHSIRQMKLTYVAAEMDVGETQVQNFNLNDLVPKAKWSGTSLSFEYADGTQSTAVDLKGEKGNQGTQGNTPAHEWSGTQLRFENPDGSFGTFVSLKGEKGEQGIQGVTGNQGIPGPQGPRGPKGDQGDESGLELLGIVSAPSTSYTFPPQSSLIQVRFPGEIVGYLPTEFIAG